MTTSIGLDIGTSAVRAAQVSTGGRGAARLDRLGQVKLPAGAVRDGEIVDRDTVAEAIAELWGKCGLKGRKVALGVANQHVVVRQVDLPYLPDDELRASLPLQTQEYLPIPVDQATLDCYVLEHVEHDDGRRFSRIMLVAAQTEMVKGIVDVVQRAKLQPVLLDLDAFALLRAVGDDSVVAEPGGELLVDLGASVTNLVVHEHGLPRFVRMLLMGSAGITEGLTSGLGMEHAEAERAKAATRVGGGTAVLDDVARVVVDRAGRLVDEIRGSLDYYSAQSDAVDVRRVVLTGGGALQPQFDEQLSAALHLPVERAHPLARLKVDKVGLEPDALAAAEPFLAVAVGLALGGAA